MPPAARPGAPYGSNPIFGGCSRRGTEFQLAVKYRTTKRMEQADAAYIAGLIDGEGTVTLSRKHARDNRQLVVSISSTERPILEFVLAKTGTGKITNKRTSRVHHAPSYAYTITNRQALELLRQTVGYMHS